MIVISPIYAALCALFYVYLSFKVIGGRRGHHADHQRRLSHLN